jgi:small multidrug resistance pump
VTTWWQLGVAIVCEVTATLALRGALDRPLLYVVVVGGYLAAFWCLAVLLRSGAGLGVVYGIWAATGVAATALLSAAIFGERLTGTMVVGLVVIVIGVLIVETGSQQAHTLRDRAQR